MATNLTPQQLSFCQHIVDGKDQTEAYKSAYPKCRSGHAQSASKLLTIPKIKAEIARLRSKTETKQTLTRQRIRELRYKIAEGKKVNNTDKLAAMRDEAKMMGYDEAERLEVSGGLTLFQRIRQRNKKRKQ